MADLLTIAQLESGMDFAHIQDLRTSIILAGGDIDDYQNALMKRSSSNLEDWLSSRKALAQDLISKVQVVQRDSGLWGWKADPFLSEGYGLPSSEETWKDFASFLVREVLSR